MKKPTREFKRPKKLRNKKRWTRYRFDRTLDEAQRAGNIGEITPVYSPGWIWKITDPAQSAEVRRRYAALVREHTSCGSISIVRRLLLRRFLYVDGCCETLEVWIRDCEDQGEKRALMREYQRFMSMMMRLAKLVSVEKINWIDAFPVIDDTPRERDLDIEVEFDTDDNIILIPDE